MVLKKLDELSAAELRIELKRVGIKGKYVKAQAIMRLTTHLIDISEDPITFEFDPEVPIEEGAEDDPDEYVVTGDEVPNVARSQAASVSGLVDAINADSSNPPVTLPVTATAFVSTPSTAPVTTVPVTVPTTTTSSTRTTSASLNTSTITTSAVSANQNAGYNPYLAQFQGMAGMSYPNLYPGMNPWMPGMSGMAGMTGMAGMPGMPGMAGMAGIPSTSVSPMSLYNPYGSWTASSVPGTPHVWTCPPPARKSETKSSKIVSGQFDSGRREVKERQNWPQVMIDHILNPETVDYDNLDWAGLTAGMTGKILAEMDPGVTDNATINKMKHLNRMANYGMKTPMRSILNFNAVLFRAIENRALSWDNWEKIEQFHTRHLSSLTVAAVTASVGSPAVGETPAVIDTSATKGKRAESEALRKAMVAQHICFKFNRGKCEHEEDHDTNGNGLTLLHACGKCSKDNRGVVKTHGAQECKLDFWPPLFRSKHHTGRDGGVQES